MARLTADDGRVPEGRSDDDLLSPSEVSALLDLDVRTLIAWDQGEYSVVGPPPIHLTTSTKRYRWGDIRVWLEERYSGEPMGDRTGDRLIRRSEIVAMVGISTETFERWLSGAVAGVEGPPFITISRSTIRYWEGDVHEWIKSYANRSAGAMS